MGTCLIYPMRLRRRPWLNRLPASAVTPPLRPPLGASLVVRKVVLKSQFERDWRKWIVGTPREEEARGVMERLAEDRPLAPKHRDLPRKGPWGGCRDCHVRGDLVLIYSLSLGVVAFHRIGSHSELFG